MLTVHITSTYFQGIVGRHAEKNHPKIHVHLNWPKKLTPSWGSWGTGSNQWFVSVNMLIKITESLLCKSLTQTLCNYIEIFLFFLCDSSFCVISGHLMTWSHKKVLFFLIHWIAFLLSFMVGRYTNFCTPLYNVTRGCNVTNRKPFIIIVKHRREGR